MFKVEDSYLEDEVRDGFYIPSISKRAFAAELSLLYELNRICEKYGLKYFADWGTLLGAIRHRGFIPWDDDLDVCMHRNDLEKLVEVSKRELKDGFEIHSFENNDYSWKFIYNLVNTDKMNFQPEYLKTHYNFPYIAAIDIFVLDNLSDDEEYEEKRRHDVKFLLDVADLTTEENIASKDYARALEAASKVAGVKIGLQAINEIKRNLFKAAQDILRKQNYHDTEYLVQMIPWGIYHKRKIHSSYYKESVSVPFENTTISVSKKYYSLFRNHKYGNFWEIRMGVGGHGYPYYNSQREALGTDLDYVPHYKFSKQQMEKDASVKDGSLKVIAGEYKEYLKGICREITDVIESGAANAADVLINILSECQENAINFGELVERALGDNTQTVKALEKYCEELFVISQMIGESDANEFRAVTDEVLKFIDIEILNRRIVVFLPFKGGYFESFRPFYDAEMAKADTDVYVIPLPYFYKEYNGTFKGEAQYNLNKYPGDIELCDFNSIELALLYPDAIYIQNPYDEFNMAMSVPNYFYASNLKNMTDELIYVPWFTTSDFAAGNYPQNYNMQFYCTVPGVALSDTVYVSSETIRARYIEHLTDFSNGECTEVWESKIKVTPYIKIDAPASDKKCICFYTSPSAILEYKEVYFNKIARCIDVFKAARNNINVIWHIEPYELDMIQSCDQGVYDSLQSIIRSLASTNIHVDHDMSESNLTNACVAFYGDGSHLSKDFVISGKPVMILNLDV